MPPNNSLCGQHTCRCSLDRALHGIPYPKYILLFPLINIARQWAYHNCNNCHSGWTHGAQRSWSPTGIQPSFKQNVTVRIPRSLFGESGGDIQRGFQEGIPGRGKLQDISGIISLSGENAQRNITRDYFPPLPPSFTSTWRYCQYNVKQYAVVMKVK